MKAQARCVVISILLLSLMLLPVFAQQQTISNPTHLKSKHQGELNHRLNDHFTVSEGNDHNLILEPAGREAVVEDFRVNEIAGLFDGVDQTYPAVAYGDNGKSIVCWQDKQNGNWDIYAQIVNGDGSFAGTNFKVNDDAGDSDQTNPSIDIDPVGNFVICWQDKRNVDPDIYAQRFNSDGTAISSNFKINDDSGEYNQTNPAIGLDAAGNFIICWTDNRNGDDDIFAQMFDSNGALSGNNFKVNDDAAGNGQGSPDIGVDDNGNFVICWCDKRNSWKGDIYFQRYNNAGTAHGGNIIVNDDAEQNRQSDPEIAVDDDGNFVICWEDDRDDYSTGIYAQRYNDSGIAQGANFRVNDNLDYAQQDPSISIDDSGSFVICWMDFEIDWDNGDIFAKRYDHNGILLNDYIVNEEIFPFYKLQSSPAVGLNSAGDFLVCWTEEKIDRRGDIFAQRFGFNGSSHGANFQINGEPGANNQSTPAVDTDANGNFVICWEDERNDTGDIYAQRFNNQAVFLDTNFNCSGGWDSQFQPDIGLDEHGKFVVCWVDEETFSEPWIETEYNILARRFDSNGIPLSNNLNVGGDDNQSPAISVDKLGKFVVCWHNQEEWPRRDIYARRYDEDGIPQGVKFKVNDDVDNSHIFPAIGVDQNGNFIICWDDSRNGDRDIYGQRYLADGTTIGSNFKINDDVGENSQTIPAIGVSDDGKFVVCWTDDRDGNDDIYAQMFNSDGTVQGANFKVNDDTGENNQGYSTIAIDESGNFVICWQDDRNGHWDIYAQRYDLSGNPIDANYKVNNDLGTAEQVYPDVSLSSNKIYYTWQDNRIPEQKYDIYARVEYFSEPKAALSLPDTIAGTGGTIDIPITVSTDSSIGFAQFIVEFDSTVIDFTGAQTGSDITGFNLIENANLPFLPTTSGTNKNVLVQISGGGTGFFSGSDLQVTKLTFEVIGANGYSSVLAFDQGTDRTFLTTVNLHDINNGEIAFHNGGVLIPETINVSGLVSYDGTERPVPDVSINMDGASTVQTDETGYYLFPGVQPGSHILSASKPGEARECISGGDALTVLQTLAFLITLTNEQKIAADVNMDGQITGADGLAILRYLAFFTTNVGQTGQWYFLPDDSAFTSASDITINFKGYVKGDVNLNWAGTSFLTGTENGNSQVALKMGSPVVRRKNEIVFPLIMNTHNEKMNTLQLSMNYDADAADFKRVEFAGKLTGFQTAVNSSEKGEVHLALAGLNGFQGNSEIFALVFKLNSESAARINPEVARAIVNDREIVNLPSGISHQDILIVPDKYELFQNFPNPFNSTTTIKYQIPENVQVELNVYNTVGQKIKTLVYQKQEAGVYKTLWDGTDEKGNPVVSGIYLLSGDFGDEKFQKKLIFVK